MPIQEPIRLIFDYAQRRPKPGTSAIMALQGLDFNDTLSSPDAYIDYATNTLMLRPMTEYAAWGSSNVGIFAKSTIIGGGVEVKTPAKWRDVDNKAVGFLNFQQCDDSSGEYIRTTEAPGVNRGVALSFYTHAGEEPYPVWDAGWSNSNTPAAETAEVGLRLFSDGKLAIYKAGLLVSFDSLSGTLAERFVRILFIPGRRRELIILTDQAGGFSHVFDDIDEADTAPIITPETKFFVTPGDGGSGNLLVQIAPLKFATSCYFISKLFQFGKPPKADIELIDDWGNPAFPNITNASIYGDPPYAGEELGDPVIGTGGYVSAVSVLDSIGTSPFVPDGETTGARLRIDFVGDENYGPFVYGVMAEYEGQVVIMNDAEAYDATEHLQKTNPPSFSVPDDGLEALLCGELIDPQTIEASVPQLRVQVMRPTGLQLGSRMVFNGVMRRPRIPDAVVASVQRMRFEAISAISLLERKRFRSRIPMDGWALCQPSDKFSAFRYLLESIAVDPELMLFSAVNQEDGSPFRIGETPHRTNSEWNFAIEAGDTGLDVFNRLIRLCSNVAYGTHPHKDGTQFWIRLPEDLPQDPTVTLYRSIADSIDIGGHSDEDAWRWVYNDYYEEPLEAEANEIRAQGIDPRTGNIVAAYIEDEAAQDPSLPPSLRPPNWTGFEDCVGVESRMIRSDADAAAVVENLAPLLIDANKVSEWDCPDWALYEDEDGNWLPGWRMDLFKLDGVEDGQPGERRVSSFSTSFQLESDALVARDTHYTGGTIVGRGGRTVAEIQANARMRYDRRGIRDLAPSGLFLATATTSTRVNP